MVSVPEGFVRAASDVHGEAGRAWVARLPNIVVECVQEWSLALGAPFPRLSYSYACPAVRADGAPVVLKVAYPDRRLLSEAAALRLFDGRGAARLLADDLQQGALLLERLEPGTPLTAVLDDEDATTRAAEVMRQLWRPVPSEHPFPSVADWVAGMADRAPRVVRGTSFPSEWIDRALGLFAELSADRANLVVLHGDLHQGNILASRRAPWLAIDPKGVIGDPTCEAGPLLLNALPPPGEWRARTPALLARRLDILATELAFNPARLRAWCIIRAVLSAFWSLEDHGRGWERALKCARLLAALQD